jgi:hypothetical protein
MSKIGDFFRAERQPGEVLHVKHITITEARHTDPFEAGPVPPTPAVVKPANPGMSVPINRGIIRADGGHIVIRERQANGRWGEWRFLTASDVQIMRVDVPRDGARTPA